MMLVLLLASRLRRTRGFSGNDLRQGKAQQHASADITELQHGLEQAKERLKTDLRGNEDRLFAMGPCWILVRSVL